MAHEKFDVGGMTCAACQAHVDRAVCSLPGVQEVSVNLLSGSMTVDYDEGRRAPPPPASNRPPRSSRRRRRP